MSNSRKKKHLPPPPLADILGELSDAPADSGLKISPSSTPADSPPADILGKLPEGSYDSGLKVKPPSTPTDQPPAATQPATEPAPADTLRLPRGALVAMRRSGGFKFRSREVVVYRDGRVNYDDGESGPRTVWTLGDAEMAELRRVLNQANLAKLPTAGRQNPDAFAYEIIARPTRRVYAAEAFQGSLPAALAPLIQQLNRLAGMDGPS
jgi:hypothetical protein